VGSSVVTVVVAAVDGGALLDDGAPESVVSGPVEVSEETGALEAVAGAAVSDGALDSSLPHAARVKPIAIRTPMCRPLVCRMAPDARSRGTARSRTAK
jgi:hypothetical protein